MISNDTNHLANPSWQRLSRFSVRAMRALGRSAALSAVALLGVCALPTVAEASPTFPVILQEELDLGCTPQCTICHNDNYGGYRTAQRPFGVTLLSGATFADSDVGTVVGKDDDSLRAAIQYLSDLEAGKIAGKQGIDSDGDGVDDIAELRELRDPSEFGVGDMCGPKYGCGARVEPRSPLDLTSVTALGFCALGLGMIARRHSKQRKAR